MRGKENLTHRSTCRVNITMEVIFLPISLPVAIYTVKILKFGTPQTIAIIVLKLVKFDVTLH